MIDDNAFANQANVKSLELGAVPPRLSAQAFISNLGSRSPKVIVPANAVSAYGAVGTKWQGIFTIEAKQ